MSIPPLPMPPKEVLYQQYVVEGKTTYALHREYGVSYSTFAIWVLKYGLQEERALYLKQKKFDSEVAAEINADGEKTSVTESEASPEAQRGALSLVEPTKSDEILEDQSSFARCTHRQRQFILAFIDNQSKMTTSEIAKSINMEPNTAHTYLKDVDVQEAILELARRNWKFFGELSLLNRIQQLEDEGKDRADDRKLKADIIGLINNKSNISVNLQYGGPIDKRIKGF